MDRDLARALMGLVIGARNMAMCEGAPRTASMLNTTIAYLAGLAGLGHAEISGMLEQQLVEEGIALLKQGETNNG